MESEKQALVFPVHRVTVQNRAHGERVTENCMLAACTLAAMNRVYAMNLDGDTPIAWQDSGSPFDIRSYGLCD